MGTVPQRPPAPIGDGLGYRVLGFDKKTGDRLEMLRLRPQFSAHAPFEAALRDRLRQLAAFDHPAFAPLRQIDRLAGQAPALVLVSPNLPGVRLADVWAVAESFEVPVDAGAALAIVRQVAAALAALHRLGPNLAHGCLGPERLLLMADGRLVITEYVLGSGLDAMRWPREKFWHEARIALPPGRDPASCDRQTDIFQLGLLALVLLAGRGVYTDRQYPLPLAAQIAEARARTIAGTPQPLMPALAGWLAQALQIVPRVTFVSMEDALNELEQAIAGSYDARPQTIAAFVARCRAASPDLTPKPLDLAKEPARSGTPAVVVVPAVTRPVTTSTPLIATSSPSSPVDTDTGPEQADTAETGGESLVEFIEEADDRTIPVGAPPSFDDDRTARIVAPPSLLAGANTSATDATIATTPSEPATVAETPDARVPGYRSRSEETIRLLDMEVLVGMLRQPRQPFEVHVNHRRLLLVDPVVRAFRVMPTVDGRLWRGDLGDIRELVALLRRGPLRYSDAADEDHPAPGPGWPIELLLWHLGLVLRPDALLPQVVSRGLLKLTRWPDFGRIRSEPAYLKMSAVLSKRAYAIDDLFEAIGEPPARVVAFLNACAVCGLLADHVTDQDPDGTPRVPSADAPRSGLFRRLRGALGIGGA